MPLTSWKRLKTTLSFMLEQGKWERLNRWSCLMCCAKLKKRGALEKMRKARQRCSEVFRYAIATWRAEFNLAADLSSALEVHQSNHFPFLKVGELPDFLRALDSYASSRLVQVATKLLMITGVRTIELRAALWQEFDLDYAIWEIHTERLRMSRSHLVQVTTQALDLLNELKIMKGNYRYVFQGGKIRTSR